MAQTLGSASTTVCKLGAGDFRSCFYKSKNRFTQCYLFKQVLSPAQASDSNTAMCCPVVTLCLDADQPAGVALCGGHGAADGTVARPHLQHGVGRGEDLGHQALQLLGGAAVHPGVLLGERRAGVTGGGWSGGQQVGYQAAHPSPGLLTLSALLHRNRHPLAGLTDMICYELPWYCWHTRWLLVGGTRLLARPSSSTSTSSIARTAPGLRISPAIVPLPGTQVRRSR